MAIDVKTKVKKVNHIFHISDIHLRLFKRHDEYQAVFHELYFWLTEQQNYDDILIVVTGDLFHSKTEMSPEMIRIGSEFLKRLASYTDTIVITGNHDLNLANASRLDAISPIIENLNDPQLHYFKMSGVYNVGDVQFGVHSIVDGKTYWPKPDDFDLVKTKIGLYHGPVNGAVTDIGYTITSNISIKDFDFYDMVLLGDIHKVQTLSENPPIKYCGSLVQQNFGETLDGHGILIWDVEKRTSEHFEINNDYGFVTLYLNSSKMPDISKLPKNSRVRLFTSNVDETTVKKFCTILRKKYNILELSIHKQTHTNLNVNLNASSTDDIADSTYQNKLIDEFIEEKYKNISTDTKKRILDINTELNKYISDEDLPKNIHWKPIHLKFDNLFSYAEGNEINFQNMNGLYGVFSPNATGKTSAFDVISFLLFDKTSRAFKSSEILNYQKDKFSAELLFEIENIQYKIKREGTRKKNGDVKVSVDFTQINSDQTTESLNGEDRRDTNNIIRSFVGSYEDFMLTSLSTQTKSSLFIDMGQSDRKDLLSQFKGLTICDNLYKQAKAKLDEIHSKREKIAVDPTELIRINTLLETATTDLSAIEKEKQVVELELNTIQDQIEKLLSDRVSLDINYKYDFESYKASSDELFLQWKGEVDYNITKIQKLENELDRSDIDTLIANRQYLDGTYNQASHEEIEAGSKEYLETFELKNKILQQKERLQFELKLKSERLTEFLNHKYDPNCEYCISTELVKNGKSIRDEVDILELKIEQYSDQLFNYNSQIQKLSVFINQKDEYAQLKKKIDKLTDTIRGKEENHQKEILEKQKQKHLLETRNVDLNSRIEIIENNKVQLEKNRSIDEKLGVLRTEKTITSLQFTNVTKLYQTLLAEITVLTKQKEDIINQLDKLKPLDLEYTAYEYYCAIMGRDGLPYYLISKSIPEIQEEVNNILSQIVDFRIQLQVDGKNIDGFIVYDNVKKWPLELSSGMERFISGLALRAALISVSNLPKGNFMILDEGLGVLDADNLASMSMVFDILKSQIDIIILISHLDTVRDFADHIIEIQRSDGFSKINVI